MPLTFAANQPAPLISFLFLTEPLAITPSLKEALYSESASGMPDLAKTAALKPAGSVDGAVVVVTVGVSVSSSSIVGEIEGDIVGVGVFDSEVEDGRTFER